MCERVSPQHRDRERTSDSKLRRFLYEVDLYAAFSRGTERVIGTLVAFTSDQQEDPHAENHVAVERPVLVGEPDHFREHPSAVAGPEGPICRRASGNVVPTSRRRRWRRQRGAARGRGRRDSISVPHVGADRGCIFRRPSTTLSAYSSTRSCDEGLRPSGQSTTTATARMRTGSRRNRRSPCGAYARDGTAGPDMAITGGRFAGVVLPGAGATRRLPSALRSRPEFSTTGWSVYRVARPRRLSTFPYPAWLSNAGVSPGRSRSVIHSPSRTGELSSEFASRNIEKK